MYFFINTKAKQCESIPRTGLHHGPLYCRILMATILLFLVILIFLCFFGLVDVLIKQSDLSHHSHVDAKANSIILYNEDNDPEIIGTKNTSLKYILQWTLAIIELQGKRLKRYEYTGVGNQTFIERQCIYTNCYFTSNRQYLNNDYTNFDAILFSHDVFDYEETEMDELPEKRSPKQKFVFATYESPNYAALSFHRCTDRLNDFFNWTWTCRLDSDAIWGYMLIKDLNGDIIGPKKDMQWMRTEDMLPVSRKLREKLGMKTKTIAWFVSNCDYVTSNREDYVSQMENEIINLSFNMSIDKYGNCGPMKCGSLCDQMLEVDYRFYLAFENSFSEDYVTEKLLRAVKNKAIPVVYGGANYSRFLPPGSYLNARELTPSELVTEIKELMDDLDKYSEYFRWTNHYSYHKQLDSERMKDYCGLCALLNDAKKVRETSVYHNFNEWWGGCK